MLPRLSLIHISIAAKETNIEVTADFKIDTSQRITYAATISSGLGGPYTLTKADGYSGSLFFIENPGSLTLANIILDGAKETPVSYTHLTQIQSALRLSQDLLSYLGDV